MLSLDLVLAPYAVLACTVVFFYLLWRHPAGAPVYSYTVIGLGGVPIIGDYRYATFMTVIQAFGVAFLFIKAWHRGRSLEPLRIFTGPGAPLALALTLVWVKIGVDLSFNGIGRYQLDALKSALFLVIEPALIFMFALATTPPQKVVGDFLMGMLLMCGAYLAPTLPSLLIEDQLTLAIMGAKRLTIYNLDTINSARFYFFGAVAFLGLIISGRVRSYLQILLWIGFSGASALLLLNTTRQFLFALGICGILVLPKIVRQRAGQIVFTSLVALAIAVASFTLLRTDEVKERLAADQIQFELQEQRGEIWRTALMAGLEKPLTGAGFRQFGNLSYTYDPTTGMQDEALSNAHGVFQDVFAEEGAILGALLIIAYLVSLYRSIRMSWGESSDQEFRYFAITINVMVIPTMLSGSIWESLPLHAFAIALSLMIKPRAPAVFRGPPRRNPMAQA